MEIYAIIESGGKQYKVSLGETIRLDKLEVDSDKHTFNQVLLVQDDKEIKIGQPLVKDATVVAEVVNPVIKGKKLRIFRYKAKSRYRRTKGHRQLHTDLRIIEIDGHKLTPPKKTKSKKASVKKSTSKKATPKKTTASKTTSTK